MITIAVAIGLVATCALAAAPADALRDSDKTPVAKSMTGGGADKGLLDCSGAIEINLDTVYAGDNTGAPNNVNFYSCASWNNTGGEVVYHLYLAEPTMWVTTMVTNGCDLDLAVLDSCDEDLGCLIVSDGGGVLTNVPVQGDFYFVVDGYNGAACSFTFQVDTQAPPPPPEPEVIGPFCDVVEDVTGTEFTGTTCGGLNNIPVMTCSSYSSNGLEYYYEVFVPAGASFTAEVTNTADGALYVLDSCSSPATCLAYADNTYSNQAEVITFTNETAGDTYVYLVVDTYGTDTCGDYTMSFAATGGAVSIEAATFGTVKSMFR
jgi:hypothetical protein